MQYYRQLRGLDGATDQAASMALTWAANSILPGAGTALSIAAKIFGGSGAPFTAAIGTVTIWGDGTAQTTSKSFSGANPAGETTLVNNMVATYLQTLQILRGVVPQPYSQFSAGWNQSNNGINIQYLIGPGASLVIDYNGGQAVTDFDAAKWQLVMMALQHSTFDHPEIGDKLRATPWTSSAAAIQAAIQACIDALVKMRADEYLQSQAAAHAAQEADTRANVDLSSHSIVTTAAALLPMLSADQQGSVTNNVVGRVQLAVNKLFPGETAATVAHLNARDGVLFQEGLRAAASEVRRVLNAGGAYDDSGMAQIRAADTAIVAAAQTLIAQAAAAVPVLPTPGIVPALQTPNVVAGPAPIDSIFSPVINPAQQPTPMPPTPAPPSSTNPFALDPVQPSDVAPTTPAAPSTALAQAADAISLTRVVVGGIALIAMLGH